MSIEGIAKTSLKEYWNSLIYSEKQIVNGQQFLRDNPTKIYSSVFEGELQLTTSPLSDTKS